MEIVKRIDEATAYDDIWEAGDTAERAQGVIPYLDTRITTTSHLSYVVVALDWHTGEELGYIRE